VPAYGRAPRCRHAVEGEAEWSVWQVKQVKWCPSSRRVLQLRWRSVDAAMLPPVETIDHRGARCMNGSPARIHSLEIFNIG